jgi:WD40 repeat protein
LPVKDQFGDPLPAGALARLGTTRWRHGGIVQFAVMLPDCKTVVTAADDNVVRVWDYPSGKEIRQIGDAAAAYAENPRIGRQVIYRPNGMSVAVAPDGKTVASNFDGTVRLFEIATGKALGPLQSSNNQSFRTATAMVFSPDGVHLAALEYDNTVRVWDWAKGKEVRNFSGPGPNGNIVYGGNHTLVYSPNGKMIASTSLQIVGGMPVYRIVIWDPTNGKELQSIPVNQSAAICSPVFSPDSKKLAFTGGDSSITVIEPETGRELQKIKGQLGTTSWLLFGPGSDILFCQSPAQHGVQVVDLATGKVIRKLLDESHNNGAVFYGNGMTPSMSVSPDWKTLILAHREHAPCFIDIQSGKEIGDLGNDASPISLLHFSPDGKYLLTHSNDGPAKKWEAATGKLLHTQTLPQGSMFPTVSPDGKTIASFLPQIRSYRLTDLESGKELGKIPLPARDYNAGITFSPDGRILAVRWPQDQKLDVFELPSCKKLFQINIATGAPEPNVGIIGPIRMAPSTVFFSADGKLLAAYSDPHTFALWDVTSGKRTLAFTPVNDAFVVDGAFTPDRRTVALEMDEGKVALYEIATGTIRRTFAKKPPAPATGLMVRGRVMGFVSYGVDNNQGVGTRLGFSPDGKTLFYGAPDRALYLWDLATGKELTTLKGHTGGITAIAVSPDGTTVATASSDTTGLVWDVAHLDRRGFEAKNLYHEDAWKALAETDAAQAYDAIWSMVANSQDTLGMLQTRLKPAPFVEVTQVQQLIGQLDDPQYKVRQKANLALLKMGDRVQEAVEKALAGNPPLEARKRLQDMDAKLSSPILQGEALRACRAIEVLECIGTPQARQLVRLLAEGAPGASTTTAAQQAIKRMKDAGR